MLQMNRATLLDQLEERLARKKVRNGAEVKLAWMRVVAAVLFLVAVSVITYYLSRVG